MRNSNFPYCLPVVKNRAKRLQDSQSWLVNKSILQSQIVYFAVLHWLFCISKHSKRHPERLKSPPQTLFFRPKNLISLSQRTCKKVSAVISWWYDYNICHALAGRGEVRRWCHRPALSVLQSIPPRIVFSIRLLWSLYHLWMVRYMR